MGKKYIIEVEKSDYKNIDGETLWKVQGLNTCLLSRDLDKLEEYKESEKEIHEFKVGDVCYLPSEFNKQKLIVTKIGPHMICYMLSDGSQYAMLISRFNSGAIFLYHSKLFEAFLKGDFT